MSVARNFVLAAEPQKGRGLFRRLDLEEAARIALKSLKDLGIRRVTDGGQLVGTLSGGEDRLWRSAGPSISELASCAGRADSLAWGPGIRHGSKPDRSRPRAGRRCPVHHPNAYHAYASGDRFMVLRRGKVLAEFSKAEKAIGEVIE